MDSLLQQGKFVGWNLTEELKAALIRSPDKALRYDVSSATTAYLGIAPVGTLPSAAGWLIRRITFDPAGGVLIEYANGTNNFTEVWDNRTGVTYG